MSLSQVEKQKIVEEYKINKNDTGSTEIQIALLSNNIMKLTQHLKFHKKDIHSTRGLINIVNKRKKLLKYLKNTNSTKYFLIIKKLKLRK